MSAAVEPKGPSNVVLKMFFQPETLEAVKTAGIEFLGALAGEGEVDGCSISLVWDGQANALTVATEISVDGKSKSSSLRVDAGTGVAVTGG